MSKVCAEFKPWRTFEEQLERLMQHGLEVGDRERCLKYLERLGYYRLSGYWYPLREIDLAKTTSQGKTVRASSFQPNSTFESVIRLYIFDKKLRLLALDALERIEMGLRVDIAYLLGKYDPVAHKKPQYLHGHFTKQVQKRGPAKGRTEYALWLQKYESLLHRARREPFIAHHNEKYGEPPIWAAIEVWDFGLMSKLYAGMKVSDQKEIAEKYGAANGKEMASWLRGLNFIRNVSAHHSRLWNINILERCPIPASEPNWKSLENNRSFLYFCLMQKMLNVLCPNSYWGSRFIELLEEFPQHEAFRLKDFGLVSEGWVRDFFQSLK